MFLEKLPGRVGGKRNASSPGKSQGPSIPRPDAIGMERRLTWPTVAGPTQGEAFPLGYNVSMKTDVIVKFHELALKGKNRPMFVRALADNLRRACQGTDVERVWIGHMMVGLTLGEDGDWSLVRERVRDCFGVAKFFRAHKVSPDLEHVKALISSLLKERSFDSFRITAKRADKRFSLTSHEINCELGTYVQDLTGAKVNLTKPDLEVFVDVLPREILVHFDEVRGYGALPVGVSGKVMALLSGGIDSPVAAWHMMKRGCNVRFVHFHSHPIVDTSSMEKAAELTQLLTRFQYDSSLYLVPFGEIQQRVIVATPPSYRIVLYRRLMVGIAEELARRQGAQALVTGDSLGQVSSQTLENITVVDECAHMPIFRPLIGFNKDEIVKIAREIGTFAVSILPDQDCCTLFVPRHPVTRGSSRVARKLEALIPVEELVNEALERVEEKRFTFPETAGPSPA